MPLCSIIIPLYNKEKYISRTLKSTQSQTFQDFEIIVIDDGSTDNGPEIVKKDHNEDHITFYSQKNSGPGAARNKGLKNAKGKYVTFLDADDEWTPDFLERSIKNLESNPECAASVCNFFENNLSTISKYNINSKLQHGKFRLTTDIDVKRLGYINGAMHAATILCKKDIIIELGGYFENRCLYGEDRYLWLQVLLNHPIYYDEKPMFIYHKEASELNYSNMNREFWPAITHPDLIRANCPSEFNKILNNYLAYYALKECHNHFSNKRTKTIKKIILLHPKMKEISYNRYVLLKIKLKLPYLIDAWRNIRSKINRLL